jgi:hypothetical protein
LGGTTWLNKKIKQQKIPIFPSFSAKFKSCLEEKNEPTTQEFFCVVEHIFGILFGGSVLAKLMWLLTHNSMFMLFYSIIMFFTLSSAHHDFPESKKRRKSTHQPNPFLCEKLDLASTFLCFTYCFYCFGSFDFWFQNTSLLYHQNRCQFNQVGFFFYRTFINEMWKIYKWISINLINVIEFGFL